jgi:flagellar protein FliO/FliZ
MLKPRLTKAEFLAGQKVLALNQRLSMTRRGCSLNEGRPVSKMEMIDIARYVGALVLVLALVGLAGLAARRFGVPGLATAKASRRLAVVETLMIDARHKLCIVRRDGSEHLIVVGPTSMTLVEAGFAPQLVSEPEAAA